MKRVSIAVVLEIVGLISCIFAIVYQQVLCYQKFGVILEQVIIPHWSLILIPVGFILAFVGWIIDPKT